METIKSARISTYSLFLRPVVILIVLGMVCMTGCRKEDVLEISENTLDFSYAGERKTFSIESNTNWTITVSRNATDWLTVSPNSGSKNGVVAVTAEANMLKSAREATVTVSGGGLSRTVNVTQEGDILTVSETSLRFPASGDSRTFTVTSNLGWRVSSSESWLTVSPVSGYDNSTVTATASANTSISQREAIITISGGDIKQTIRVTQSEGDAFLSVHTSDNYETEPADTIFFESSNSLSKTLFIHSNTSWNVSSSESWISVSPTSGSSIQTIEVNAETNISTLPRTATITFNGGGITRTVEVTQEGFIASLSSESTSYHVGSAGGSQAIVNIYATISWEVTTDAKWLTVTPASGTYNGSITVTTEANPIADPRTATITVSGGELTLTFTVTQSAGAAFLIVSETSLEFPETTEQRAFNINANTNWTVRSSLDWLSFSPSSGSGDGTVTVTVMANPDFRRRNATINVRSSDIQRTINVTQAGSILSVSDTALHFHAGRNSQELVVHAETNWTVSSNVSWLTITPTSGSSASGESIFYVDVDFFPNTSTSPRTATITFSGGGITRTVEVTQDGAANTGGIMFYTNRDRNCGLIRVTLSGQGTKSITGWYNYDPGCRAAYGATFSDLPVGVYTYTASCSGYSWSGTVTRTLSCHSIRLE